MERVCIYLRKSRKDIEAEQRGEGETLSKHQKALLKHAKKANLNIIKIRQEIESGESLIHRPEMMELLKEVEAGKYDAVLVMDMDRLGRGNMREQGMILDTFRESNTKIITPRKVYDLEDEFDEEYSEFEAFMARKELKIINRRLQGGRVRSIEEGNYIGTKPPYGYDVEKNRDGRYLVPNPETAPIVQMIFDLYVTQGLGCAKIAKLLNKQGILTYTGMKWAAWGVINIIKNEVYTGRIQWKKKKTLKSRTPTQKREIESRPREEWIDVEGKHEAIISEELFQKAQDILRTRTHVPYTDGKKISNPLAGLIKCAYCGSSVVRRPYANSVPHLRCYRTGCKNKSTRFHYAEERLIQVLRQWLEKYKLQWDDMNRVEDTQSIEIKQVTIKNLHQEQQNLEHQRGQLHDLLERGIYDDETYLKRSRNIADRLDDIRETIKRTTEELLIEQEREKAKVDIIPQVEYILDNYHQITDPGTKNELLKTIIDKCIYKKAPHQRNDQFELIVYPKY